MQSMRQCVNTTQLGSWLLPTRDVLIGAMAERGCKLCKSQEQESDVNFIKLYPSRFFLAPGQAHDADNHSPGSLIH